MISCTEFIPSYSELFTFLEEHYGFEEVQRYWANIFDPDRDGQLNQKVRELGLAGCFAYWAQSLNEEAADFTMYLNEADGWFLVRMHHCPSKGRLLAQKHIKPYPRYCLHCDLYRKTLERYGLCYQYDFTEIDKAACTLLAYDPTRFPGKMIVTPETKVMDRRAGDNRYCHKDFHLYMNMGVDYLGKKFGESAVRAYLQQYARHCLSPLIARVRAEGLAPLADAVEKSYRDEDAASLVQVIRAENRLHVTVDHCPAMAHIRSRGNEVSLWYALTTQTVFATLAEEAGCHFEMEAYDPQTGQASYRFTR